MPTQAGAMTSHPFETGQFDPFETQYFDFIDYTDDGGPDRSLHPGVDFGPFQFCFNTTPSMLIGDVTAIPQDVGIPLPVSDFLCPAHGLSNGDQVRFDTDGMLPIGLFLATYYFVINASTDKFQVSETSGGSVVSFVDAGVGHINVTKRGQPFDLTGATPYAWVKPTPETADPPLLDLQPTILTPNSNGVVQIYVVGSLTNMLVDLAAGAWNLLIKLSGGQRFNAARGRFDINQLPTHPGFP